MSLFDDFSLYSWFKQNKRVFPWRKTPSPYQVWVSEIMLQQTRASVVVPYYLKWMDLFPTIEKLAFAPTEQVIKAWEGLGYYSRARNLQIGAKQIIEEFDGKVPNNEKDLLKIKGIGPYTFCAILAFAFGEKKAAVDANVLRFLSRLFCIEENVKTTVSTIAQDLVQESSFTISEALIEFGALVCTPSPKCSLCPFQKTCLAKKYDKTTTLPIKIKMSYEHLQRVVFVIRYKNQYLVKKNTSSIMKDLFEFPYQDVKEKWRLESILKKMKIQVKKVQKMKNIRQSFTKYKVLLHPFCLFIDSKVVLKNFEWISFENIQKLPFSSGHRKILHNLKLGFEP